MNLLKKPVVAALLAVIVILSSSLISISVKLDKKCDELIEGFYSGTGSYSFSDKSISSCINEMCGIAGEVVLIADNYGIDTRELSKNLNSLRSAVSYHNEDIDEIYKIYSNFYNSLWTVELELSNVGLSQRHLEYMSSASGEIEELKSSIDNAAYNDSVRAFYKSFDRFPVNFFADMFDIDYPEYFA